MREFVYAASCVCVWCIVLISMGIQTLPGEWGRNLREDKHPYSQETTTKVNNPRASRDSNHPSPEEY